MSKIHWRFKNNYWVKIGDGINNIEDTTLGVNHIITIDGGDK